jgi:hypothetical protein
MLEHDLNIAARLPFGWWVLSWETRLLFIHFECLLSRSVIPDDSSSATQGNWQEL